MSQVDEFGRAIPAVGGGGGGGANDDRYSDYDRGGYSSSYQQQQQAPPPRNDYRGGGGRPRYNDDRQSHYPPPQPPPQQHQSYYGDRSGDRGGGGGYYHNSHNGRDDRGGGGGYYGRDGGPRGGRERSPPRRNLGGKEGGGDDGAMANPQDNNNISGDNNKPKTSAGSSATTSPKSTPTHPCQRYVAEPMLCEFLWKEEQKKKKQEEGGDSNKNDENQNSPQQQAETEVNTADADAAEKHEADNNNNDDDEEAAEQKKRLEQEEKDKQAYDEYRLNYAWNFLKHFFNQHLDDSWFRQRYSPLLLVEQAQLERRRRHHEAALLRAQVPTYSQRDLALTLPTSSAVLQTAPTIPAAHYCGTHHATLWVRHVPPHVTDEHIRQALLPYLSDYVVQQQQQAETPKVKKESKKQSHPSQAEVMERTVFGLFSSTPNNTNHYNNSNNNSDSNSPMGGGGGGGGSRSGFGGSGRSGGSVFLHRSVFCVLTSRQVLDGVWQLLAQRDHVVDATATAAEGGTDPPKSETHVPRKQDDHKGSASSTSSHSLDLEIDCTDPYGRAEYDANGRGGPPPDGLAVPPRKAVVPLVRYYSHASSSGGSAGGGGDVMALHKLSTALSSPTRFASDLEAATTIARALDVRQHVPVPDRLDSLLEAVAASSSSSASPSYALDVALCYLRRVHLYNFYKATFAESFGDYLAGRSAAAQVQLREDVPEGALSAEDLKEDLLGQRLDQSLQQVLEHECPHVWIPQADWYVNEWIDGQATEIEQRQAAATDAWLANHVMDDDGRARCSFHFCHKLFKDESFLSKHLLKKHAAFHAAERAKCHDAYMMRVWERGDDARPVCPPIVVDCGQQFGHDIPSYLSGGPEPRAPDPEPALWERQQAQEKLLQERQELRAKRQQQQHEQGGGANGGAPPGLYKALSAGPSGGRAATFVDVDDMKEETVEVSFDQVTLPSVSKKKKKKKRKLL